MWNKKEFQVKFPFRMMRACLWRVVILINMLKEYHTVSFFGMWDSMMESKMVISIFFLFAS